MKALKEESFQQTEHLAISNESTERIYELITSKAIDLLKGQNQVEFRTYCEMDHSKNELNTKLLREFVCYFWNITLLKDLTNGRYYIELDFAKEGLALFGNARSNSLIFKIFSVIPSNMESSETDFPLFINFVPVEHLTYWYSTIARGESEYVNIYTLDFIYQQK
jgi:hypothetical protein